MEEKKAGLCRRSKLDLELKITNGPFTACFLARTFSCLTEEMKWTAK
jgi:hypothetical protein